MHAACARPKGAQWVRTPGKRAKNRYKYLEHISHDRAAENHRRIDRHRRGDARDRPPCEGRGARAGARLDGAEGPRARPRWRRRSAPRRPTFSPPTPRTWPTPRRAAQAGAFLDRLALDDKRVEAMAAGARGGARAARSGRRGHRILDAAERHDDRARARAARRHRHHLREPPERDRRRRRAVPEGRQRRDPARRLRQPSLGARHPRRARRRACATPACPRTRSQLVPTRDRAAVGHDAAGPRRRHRRDRAARRQEPGGARAGRGARAGVRASRRRLPRLCRQGRRLSTWRKPIVLNAKMRRTGVCGAAETLLVDRAAAATHLKPLVDDAARRRLRDARRRAPCRRPIRA